MSPMPGNFPRKPQGHREHCNLKQDRTIQIKRQPRKSRDLGNGHEFYVATRRSTLNIASTLFSGAMLNTERRYSRTVQGRYSLAF